MVAPRGACVVAPGRCAWLLLGGYAWLLPGGHAWIWRDMEIWSMSGWYASYWNAFLFGKMFAEKCIKMKELGQRRGTLIPSVIPLDLPMVIAMIVLHWLKVVGRSCFQPCLSVILLKGTVDPKWPLSMIHWTSPYRYPHSPGHMILLYRDPIHPTHGISLYRDPHQTLPLKAWDLTVQGHPAPTPASDIWWPRLEAFSNYSLEDPPIGADLWWLLKHIWSVQAGSMHSTIMLSCRHIVLWLVVFDTFRNIGDSMLKETLHSFSLKHNWVGITLEKQKTHPGNPPASIWFAIITSSDQTSYCHFLKPSTPDSTAPVWTPIRMSTFASVASRTSLCTWNKENTFFFSLSSFFSNVVTALSTILYTERTRQIQTHDLHKVCNRIKVSKKAISWFYIHHAPTRHSKLLCWFKKKNKLTEYYKFKISIALQHFWEIYAYFNRHETKTLFCLAYLATNSNAWNNRC